MDFNVNKSANQETLAENENQRQEEKERKWRDPNEDVKYVCEGGKVRCKHCSSPVATLKVTAENVMLQDKPWATVGDNNGQANFGFTGICTHPKWGNHKPPCKSVISLGQWANHSETIIGNHHALLVKSTIRCMVSGEDLKIVHSGQAATLDQINPLDRRKVLLDAYWLDGEEKRRDLHVNIPVTLYVQVKNAKAGEKLPLTFTSEKGSKVISYMGMVGANGLITINEFVLRNRMTSKVTSIKAFSEGIIGESKLELRSCLCDRDISIQELKDIVKKIRDNTFYDIKEKKKEIGPKTKKTIVKEVKVTKPISYFHKMNLFYDKHSNVPVKDRTFEMFAKVLNDAFRKYGITKCSHKIHFIANMYVETMYFTATRELGEKLRYDPYRGRGFLHLTHKENYQKYKDATNVDVVKNYKLVAHDLAIAADTAAWYWKMMKLNDYAEKDSIFNTARLINFPNAKTKAVINGYKEREMAWKQLKRIFSYPQACNTAIKERGNNEEK